MVLAPRCFRDEEYLVPRSILEEGGCEVTTASSMAGHLKGSRGTWVRADVSIHEARVSSFDAVVFVGGFGARVFFDDRGAHRLCREAAAAGKVLAALCVAPGILARAGVLEWRRATCWPGEKEVLVREGAVYTGEHVTVDGRIVTADGPSSAREFALAVLAALERTRPGV